MERDDRHNCSDPPPRQHVRMFSANHFVSSPACTPSMSQVSHASEVAPSGFPRLCARFVPTLQSRNWISSATPRKFRKAEILEFLTANLSRRRSRVRVPSSPPFLFKVFPAFSNICPRYAAIGLATPCDINRHEMPPILGSNWRS